MHKFEFVDNKSVINWDVYLRVRRKFMHKTASDSSIRIYSLAHSITSSSLVTTRLIHNYGNAKNGKYVLPNWCQHHPEFYSPGRHTYFLVGTGPFNFAGIDWCFLILGKIATHKQNIHSAALLKLDGYGHLPSIPGKIADDFNYRLSLCCMDIDFYQDLSIETYLQDKDFQILGPQRLTNYWFDLVSF